MIVNVVLLIAGFLSTARLRAAKIKTKESWQDLMCLAIPSKQIWNTPKAIG